MQNKSALLILNSITFLVFLFLLYNYIHEQNHQVEATQQAVTQKMRVAIQQIDKMLSELSTIAHSMADDLSTGKLHRSQIMERLETNLAKTPYRYGIGVAYIPYVNNPQMRRGSPYYLKSFENQEEPQLQFTAPCSYREPNTQVLLSQCLVFVDYSLKAIQALIAPLNIGKTGYGFILSKQAVFITHPIIATVQNDKILKRLAQIAINGGESGIIDTIDTWAFYQPIPTTGWTLVVVVAKNEILELQHQQNLLSLVNFLPIFIILGMLFAILLLLGKVKSFTNVIAPIGALFLATILAHIGLRMEISTSEIIYLDYFYLVTYIAIFAVVSCYFLFYNKNKLSNNGLIVKLLFWPLILGTLLAITIWKFY
jgi:hypothetical protein